MLDTVRFAHDRVLYLLLLLPAVWLARRRYLSYLAVSRERLEAGLGLQNRGWVGPFGRARLTTLLAFAATALLIVALAGPQVFRTETKPILRQLDVVFLLDVSPSMGAEDVAPSRLERALQVIREVLIGEPLIRRA